MTTDDPVSIFQRAVTQAALDREHHDLTSTRSRTEIWSQAGIAALTAAGYTVRVEEQQFDRVVFHVDDVTFTITE